MAGRFPPHVMLLGLAVLMMAMVGPSHSEKVYFLSKPDQKFNIKRANAFCRRLKGHLAEIHNQLDYQRIVKTLRGRNIKGWIYLGGNDIDKEGTWVWYHSGKPVMSGLDWAPNQPDNNIKGRPENCLGLGSDSSYKLNDRECDDPGRYICELPGEIYYGSTLF